MSARNVDEYEVITAAVAKACSDANVRAGSEIQAHLIHDCEVLDQVDVIAPSMLDGRSVSLEQRLMEMRSEDRWKAEFNAKPAPSRPNAAAATPAGSILTPDRSQFADLVSGKAVMR